MMIERGRIHAAARLLMAQKTAAARALLDRLPAHGEHGAVLAERLRFGPPETWHGWRRGDGAVAVKLWPEATTKRLSAVTHTGVAPLVASGDKWRVFAWIAGESLARLLRCAKPLDGAGIVTGLEDALAALHASGQAHGDLNPTNVVITAHGRPVLIDWGETDAMTPGWCPDGPHTPQERDRYALGRLRALLTGSRPPEANRP